MYNEGLMNKFSILHISDLHKLEGTNYKALLQSLLTDKDTYVGAGVTIPKYVVVSGDLIHGGSTEDEIRRQYAETLGFLTEVTDEFLDGNKKRMLIVPGNHDVSFPHSKNSMIPEADEHKEQNLKLFWDRHPEIRWNWKDFSFYKIADKDEYEKRFNLFKAFYNDFYQGDRTYSEDPQFEAECYSFPEDRVTFALFNSCKQLDHLNDTAAIDDDAIVSVMPELRANYNRGYLNIAVWHHHFYGAPRETNYLDREVINKMSHSYIQMGLFGHQHISQIAEFYGGDLALGDSPDNQRVLLVSSGTLFGGKKELPDGRRRQYNVIEITQENGTAQIEIHVREDDNRSVDSKLPIWRMKQVGPTGSIKTNVKLKQMNERTILADILRTAQADNDYIRAYEQLQGFTTKDDFYMRIRSEIIRRIKDNRYLLDNLKPETDNDYMLLMTCAERENDAEAKARLKSDSKLQSMLTDKVLKEMYDRL